MQSGARFRLVVRRGPQPNQQYELNRDTVTIGRDITNDIVINDPEVSRHHARLVRTPTGYAVEDLRSTNGTFVNRQRVTTQHPLTNGDLLGMGETVILVFEAMGVGAEVPMAPAPHPQPAYEAPVYAPPPAAPAQPMYEEEAEPDRNRWVIIGCAALTLAFCCALVVAAIIIDRQNAYCTIPVMKNISFFCSP